MSASAAIIPCWLALNAVVSCSYSEDMGMFPEAPQAAVFLKGYLKQGDAVIAPVPQNEPLRYYCIEAGLTRQEYGAITENVMAGRRLLILVPEGRPVQEVARDGGVSLTGYGEPAMVWRYRSAALYELKKKER